MDGRTDVRTGRHLTHVIRSTLRSRPNNRWALTSYHMLSAHKISNLDLLQILSENLYAEKLRYYPSPSVGEVGDIVPCSSVHKSVCINVCVCNNFAALQRASMLFEQSFNQPVSHSISSICQFYFPESRLW